MSRHYHSIAFTEPVVDAQIRYGSRAAVDRADRHHVPGPAQALDPMGSAEREFIAGRDGFYLASVSEAGWAGGPNVSGLK